MDNINVDLESKESMILVASIPIAVIIGTIIAIIAFKTIGETSGLYAILGGAIIVSVITYLFSRSKQS